MVGFINALVQTSVMDYMDRGLRYTPKSVRLSVLSLMSFLCVVYIYIYISNFNTFK